MARSFSFRFPKSHTRFWAQGSADQCFMATGVRSSILDEVVLGKGSEFVIKKMRGRHPPFLFLKQQGVQASRSLFSAKENGLKLWWRSKASDCSARLSQLTTR